MNQSARPVRTLAHEISLLPRHWEWLAEQPRSASATLRLLVEGAWRDANGHFAAQAAKDRCYFYMRDMAGDRPHFEEACRALFADNLALFEEMLLEWPTNVQREAQALAAPVWRVMAADRRSS